jgi:hypothetical protein
VSHEHRPAHQPKGVKGHRNLGRYKKCDCGRRHWARCPHPVWGNFRFNKHTYRARLDRQYPDPKRLSPSWSDAAQLIDRMRAEIRAGVFVPYANSVDR